MTSNPHELLKRVADTFERNVFSWSFLRLLVACSLLVIPWINPFAPGPSPSVLPWLISLFCAAALVGFAACWPVGSSGRHLASVLALSWLIAGLLSVVMGLLQYFGADGVFGPWVNHTRVGEAFANLRQRNQFATLANISLAALIYFAKASPIQTGNLIVRTAPCLMLSLFAAGALSTGIAASSSRTGLVQLLLICALCGLWGLWRRAPVRHMLLTAVLAYGIASIALPLLAGFDLSMHGMAARLRAGDQECVSRLTLWSNVLKLIALKPWMGWGPGELDYAHYITLYDGPRFCDILDNAHNLPLHLAVELGVPASLAICGGFIVWAIRRRPWAETDPARQLAWSVLAVILLHSMLEYPLWYGPFQMAAVLCVAILWRREKGVKVSPVEEVGMRSSQTSLLASTVLGLTATALMAASVYAAWDYHRISQIYLSPPERDAAYRSETMDKIQSSWLFADQVRFAQLLITPLTLENARWTLNTAILVLHYSPEPRVAEKIIESAVMLGLDTEALEYLARYRAAFPDDYARWAKMNATGISGLDPSHGASR